MCFSLQQRTECKAWSQLEAEQAKYVSPVLLKNCRLHVFYQFHLSVAEIITHFHIFQMRSLLNDLLVFIISVFGDHCLIFLKGMDQT